jgi:hypothetical protein
MGVGKGSKMIKNQQFKQNFLTLGGVNNWHTSLAIGPRLVSMPID